MASFIDRIKKSLFGSTTLTPRELESLIIDNFIEGKNESTLKNRIYYPTSFKIFLESSDFERLNQHFPGIFEDAVDEFVKLLTNEIPKGHYLPHSKKWQFQFIENTEGMLLKGKTIDLPSGNVLIVSTLYSKGEAQGGTNTVVATKTKVGSAGGRYEINPEILNEISEKGEFTYEKRLVIIPKGGGSASKAPGKQSKATLTLVSGGTFIGGMKSVGLVEPQVKVCGKKGFPGAGVQIVRIEDDLVSNPHFIIYEQDGAFMIEAQASLILNGNNITGSTEALPDNAMIIIANKHQLRFSIANKNKDGNPVSKLVSKFFS